jgi:ubiquinone/menaquinone biosynthesis C-methylase UbiE
MKPVDFQEIYWNGRHYDLKNEGIQSDVGFYLRQIKTYGDPALELGCGTGRITIPLAQAGIDITGLDVLDTMLSVAKNKAKSEKVKIEWVKADCRNFHLNRKFNYIFFPFNSILHLHDVESYEACFSCVKRFLTGAGKFVIDVFNPRLDILTRDSSERVPIAEYPDPDGKGIVVVTETNQYDRADQINHIKWHYDIGNGAEKFIRELNLRILFPKEFDTLLHYNGFAIEKKYGDFDKSDFDSGSPRQIVTCRVES